jgi:CubicO group peptidase (beta-lactamase class C family)
MTHTAGFEEYVIGLFAKDTDRLLPLGDILAQELPARVRPPGDVAAYSNHGTAIAAYIVEQVSGMAWDDYVEENILKPLGMAHTTFRQPVPQPLSANVSKGYTYSEGEFHEEPFVYVPLAPVAAASRSPISTWENSATRASLMLRQHGICMSLSTVMHRK